MSTLGSISRKDRESFAGLSVLPAYLPAPNELSRWGGWPVPHTTPCILVGELTDHALLVAPAVTGFVGFKYHDSCLYPGRPSIENLQLWWHPLNNLVLAPIKTGCPTFDVPKDVTYGLTGVAPVAEDLSMWPIKCPNPSCRGPAYQGAGAVECKNRCRP